MAVRSIFCGAIGLFLTLLPDRIMAQTNANTDAVYDGYISAYLQTTNVNGHTYPLPYICNSLTDRNLAFMWQQAYMISGLQDAYDKTHSASRLSLISSLLNGFITQNGVSLTWDTWNDDIEWADIALAHGYEETGNTAYLSAATENWNDVWSRGWSSDLGGGIWENQNKGSKCVLSNAPFIIAGCMLYRATGNSTYLTESEQSYAWIRSHCFNTSTGQVIEGISSSGAALTSNNSYNHGIFLQAANALYQITGTAQYYNDALLVVDWVVNNHAVMTEDHPNNGPFGSEEFFRGLSIFATQNKLWPTYYAWMEANCTAAWNHRRTDYNITANNFEANTSTGNLLAMETISSLVVQAVTPPRFEFESLTVEGFSGPDYRLLSDSNMSGGAGVILDSTAAGNYISFVVPAIAARTYDVRVGVKKINSRGICQLAIGYAGNNSPTNVGAPQDLYSASSEYVELDLGSWTPGTNSDKWFWFKITGKNGSSAGFTECFDYILLYPQ